MLLRLPQSQHPAQCGAGESLVMHVADAEVVWLDRGTTRVKGQNPGNR